MVLVFVNSYQKLLIDSLGTLCFAVSWISILVPAGHVYSGHSMILKETSIFSPSTIAVSKRVMFLKAL